MKNIKQPKLEYLLLFIGLTCCVSDDEFQPPEPTVYSIEITGDEISFPALKNALLQEIDVNGNNLLRIVDDIYVSGYVISNDEHGNFFEELIIQNDGNPGSGLKILIDSNPLFQSFEFGRKVYVRLKDLTVGFNNGQLSLGIRNGNRLGQIAESQIFNFLKRDTLVVSIQPSVYKISELNEDLINTFIRLEEVQFNRYEALGENPLTYAGEPGDEFDGERILESCMEDTSIIFSTSTFADFKNVRLAPGRGAVEGIFTFNFFGDEFNMVVNDLDGVMLEHGDRCDPPEIDCGVLSESGKLVIFNEFFETQSVGDPISGNGWTNYIEAGTETWEAYFDDGANASLGISARMGSFMSGDDASVGWLITPEINFDLHQGESINFKTSNSFADGSTLEVLFSADWDGIPETITSANWELLSSANIVQDEDYFGDWIGSGIVDLSCITGTGYIAWKYTGSGDPDFDGTYELDEISIKAE